MFFIAPGKFEDNVYVDILSDVVSTGLRKLFSVITQDNLLRDVSRRNYCDVSIPQYLQEGYPNYSDKRNCFFI